MNFKEQFHGWPWKPNVIQVKGRELMKQKKHSVTCNESFAANEIANTKRQVTKPWFRFTSNHTFIK